MSSYFLHSLSKASCVLGKCFCSLVALSCVLAPLLEISGNHPPFARRTQSAFPVVFSLVSSSWEGPFGVGAHLTEILDTPLKCGVESPIITTAGNSHFSTELFQMAELVPHKTSGLQKDKA